MRSVCFVIAVLFCCVDCFASAQSAEADQPAGPLPDVLSKASKDSFELLTAPRAAPADMTIKIVGEQRHWTYTYTSPPGPAFKGSANASNAERTVIDADLVVPQGKSVELLVTANDQIYELKLPEPGSSLTAIPGRLQSYTLLARYAGRFVAVCSSDCDAAGSVDPIVIHVVSPDDFERWLRVKSTGIDWKKPGPTPGGAPTNSTACSKHRRLRPAKGARTAAARRLPVRANGSCGSIAMRSVRSATAPLDIKSIERALGSQR
jgi:cytochrome c oxidase subunit II